MTDVLDKLAEAYAPRRIHALPAREQAGTLFKVYAVEAADREVTDAQVTAALALADAAPGDLGLGVVVVHAGEDSDYVVVHHWTADYQSRLQLFGGPDLAPAPAGVGPCVWEAEVLAYEQAAYVDHVLIGRSRSSWVADTLTVDPEVPRHSPWYTAEPMRGDHVILEPLDPSHAADLLAATADAEVWQHLHLRRPATEAAMSERIADILHEHRAGHRVPWIHRDAVSGAVAGTTSYYDIDDARGSVAIGHTILGKPWWRTGINTETNLLLLTRAFEELGAERVECHVDTVNERSQAAVARTGVVREGVLRHHHRWETDGSLRDMVLYSVTADEWPALKSHLRALLRPVSG